MAPKEPRIIRQFKQNLEVHWRYRRQSDQSALFGAPTWRRSRAGSKIAAASTLRRWCVVADTKQMQLGHVAEADARWRIYAFAGKADGSDAGSAIHRLADWLETTTKFRFMSSRHAEVARDIDALIDFRAVFQQTFEQLAARNNTLAAAGRRQLQTGPD